MQQKNFKEDDRGVRIDSVTNQLRILAKNQNASAKKKQHHPSSLEPLGLKDDSSFKKESLKRQIQGPITLQWLVDDFVKAAGAGDVEKVDKYIRGGIPINMKHSVRDILLEFRSS